MSTAGEPEPIPADDDLRAAIADAELPPLLAALARLTGDLSLLRDDVRPNPQLLMGGQDGLTEDQRIVARALAFDAVVRLRDQADPAPAPDDDSLRRMMEFIAGQTIDPGYLPLLRGELALAGEDLQAPQWNKDEIDPERDFLVAIIGAGMSGLQAAHRLQQAGVSYVVIEKNDDVGGTWLENTYPGCRVDVANHAYSYSFAQRPDWPNRFTPQPVLLDYFRDCADQFDLRKHIRFETAVVSATYSDDRGIWVLELRTPDGSNELLEAHAVISAVGQLNRPNLPPIEGRDSFVGPAFHSGQWDHRVDLNGTRVAVIGTGASAIQLIPEVAKQAAELTIFQRTPNWFGYTPHYHAALPAGLRQLFACLPYYLHWYRLSLFWRTTEGISRAARVDPEWVSDTASVSRASDDFRAVLTGFLEEQLRDRPDLLEHVVPDYPPLAKRILLDNGSWTGTLMRDNVELVTDPIERITPEGVVTADGVEHQVDVIIYGTGFRASNFLMPMRVTGRGGVDLHEQWDGTASAYLGITVPGFPNLFCLYGPNTNLVANGSIIFFSECETHYVLGCLRELLERHRRALDCTREAYDEYSARMDEGNRAMVWGAANVNTWYKNAAGRVTQNWPFSLLEFWQQTREPNLDHYEVL